MLPDSFHNSEKPGINSLTASEMSFVLMESNTNRNCDKKLEQPDALSSTLPISPAYSSYAAWKLKRFGTTKLAPNDDMKKDGFSELSKMQKFQTNEVPATSSELDRIRENPKIYDNHLLSNNCKKSLDFVSKSKSVESSENHREYSDYLRENHKMEPNYREYSDNLRDYHKVDQNHYSRNSVVPYNTCSHPHSCSNDSQNNDTIKNLLQLVNSQNEQIRTLHQQIDKLLHLHEQSLKDSKKCTCWNKVVPLSSPSKLAPPQNQAISLEQKVSIGVMTSFELKLQNSQTTMFLDSDRRLINSPHKNKQIMGDSEQKIRKNRNPSTQNMLENISEANESNVSSQMHSSRQSPEVPSSSQNRSEMIVNKRHYVNNKNQTKDSGFDSTANSKNTGPSNYDYRSRDSNAPDRFQGNKRENFVEESLDLTNEYLNFENRSTVSPDPSIHVEMQEYESEDGDNAPKYTPELGWTFYNNVLEQVNRILHTSPLGVKGPQENGDDQGQHKNAQYEKNVFIDTVKAATLEQLKNLGISFAENQDSREQIQSKRVMFDNSYYPTLKPQTQYQNPSSSSNTNTSIHMKALAMKYLSDQQLTELATQPLKSQPLQNMMCNNNMQSSNLSFATMHYLQRYHLLPSEQNSPNLKMASTPQVQPRRNEPAIRALERQKIPIHKVPHSQTSNKMTCPSKILDISTLKQQPKLL